MKEKRPSVPAYVTNFPFPPDRKKPARITRESSAQHLYGFEGAWNDVYTFVSTDKLTLSLYYLPPGGFVDPPGHHRHGDEYYHIIEGEAVLANPVTGESLHLDTNDTAYIPQGTRHQIFNFTDRMLAVLSILAPVPWKEDGMGTRIERVERPLFFSPGIDTEVARHDT